MTFFYRSLLIAFAWLCLAPMDAQAAAWEDNVSRAGAEYYRFVVNYRNNWEDCATPCADDIRCAAFTFVRATAECLLESALMQPYQNACCISGTIFRTQQGVALADLTGSSFVLRDPGEQTFATITFNQGTPNYQTQGTIRIDDVTVTFGGPYNPDGILDLYLAVPKGSLNLKLLVRRTSYPNPTLGHAQLVGTGSLTAPNDDGVNETTTANLVGTCSQACPY